MSDETKWEEIRMAEEDGVFYLLVDERMILRSSSKRIVEHYYKLMISDDWQGPRVITPDRPSKDH